MSLELNICYLSGSPVSTRDRVPPRGIFPAPLPDNPVTCRLGNPSIAVARWMSPADQTAAHFLTRFTLMVNNFFLKRSSPIFLILLKIGVRESLKPADTHPSGAFWRGLLWVPRGASVASCEARATFVAGNKRQIDGNLYCNEL